MTSHERDQKMTAVWAQLTRLLPGVEIHRLYVPETEIVSFRAIGGGEAAMRAEDFDRDDQTPERIAQSFLADLRDPSTA